jgi:hypothetical protein
MEAAIPWWPSIKLFAEAGYGPNWLEAKEMILLNAHYLLGFIVGYLLCEFLSWLDYRFPPRD